MTLADINWPLILAGLGLFLFGIDYMGDGLKSYAGDKLKDIIDKYTSSPVKGILIGALVTCLIQSSSGTTALTIGLIRSGLMNLNQAVGIIMGANIGTVITSVLVGLKISKYAVYFIIIGAFVSMFSKNKKTKYLSQIIFETTFNQCNYMLIKSKNKECSNNIEETMNTSELQTR